MDEGLYKAAMEGNTQTLINLIQQDPLILDRSTVTTTHLETPLHIAAMLGHDQFAIELLKRKPGLASELDRRGSSALHLGSAKGHVGVVKQLLQINPDMCFACDRDGKNPLHIAAMMGRTDALKEMLMVKPDAGCALVKHGGSGTILHLCVEYSQFEALKILVEDVNFDNDFINSKDKCGNTILHLAVADKQVETTEFLLSVAGMDCNAVNLSGKTAMEILIERRRDVRDLEMEESLKRAAASRNIVPTYFHKNNKNVRSLLSPHPESSCRDVEKNVIWKKLLEHRDDWLERKRSGLMVVASLIATMAFQAGITPPKNVWEEETKTVEANDLRGFLAMAYDFLKNSELFYMINTLSFIASLSIILLLMSGLPLKRKVFVWILMVTTWIAITAIALSYTIAVIIATPKLREREIYNMVGVTVFAWICLMALLLVGHTIRLFVKMIKLFVKMVKLMFRSLCATRKTSSSALPRNI